MKTRTSLLCFMVGIALLCQSAFTGTTKGSIEWTNFTTEDLDSVYNDTSNSYLIHFREGPCNSTCLEELNLVKQNNVAWNKLSKDLIIKTADFTGNPDVGIDLELVQNSALFLIYKGHPVRIDHLDSVGNKVDYEKEIQKILTHSLKEVDSIEEIRELLKATPYLHVFYGGRNSRIWIDAELVAKVVDPLLYFTENVSVATEFGFEKTNNFYTIDGLKNVTLTLQGRTNFPQIELFIKSSSQPLVRDFNINDFRQSTSEGLPVLILHHEDPKEKEHLLKIAESIENAIRTNFHTYKLSNKLTEEETVVRNYCIHEGQSNQQFAVCILHLGPGGEVSRYLLDPNPNQHVDLNQNTFNKFIRTYLNGELPVYLRTENITEKYTKSVRNLNSLTVSKFLGYREEDDSVKVLLIYNSTFDNATFENLSSNYKEKIAKFGRINLQHNELLSLNPKTKIPFIIVGLDWDDESREDIELGPKDNISEIIVNAIEKRIKKLDEDTKKAQAEDNTDL